MRETIFLIIGAVILFICGIKLMEFGQKVHLNISIKNMHIISRTGLVLVLFSMTVTCFTFSPKINAQIFYNQVFNNNGHLLKATVWLHGTGYIFLFSALIYLTAILWTIIFQRKSPSDII